MESWAQRVVAKWATEGVKINENTTTDAIESTEVILDFKFPENFKELYLEMNGFKGLAWQKHMFHFWSLEKIIEEHKESEAKNFIGFCDFLLGSNFIGFNKNSKGVFKKYSEMYSDLEDGEFIANSFEEVVGMINSSDDPIY
jgi:hypothetical protein